MSGSSNIGYHLHPTLTMNYQIIKIKHSEIIGTYIAMLTPVTRKQNTTGYISDNFFFLLVIILKQDIYCPQRDEGSKRQCG